MYESSLLEPGLLEAHIWTIYLESSRQAASSPVCHSRLAWVQPQECKSNGPFCFLACFQTPLSRLRPSPPCPQGHKYILWREQQTESPPTAPQPVPTVSPISGWQTAGSKPCPAGEVIPRDHPPSVPCGFPGVKEGAWGQKGNTRSRRDLARPPLEACVSAVRKLASGKVEGSHLQCREPSLGAPS